MVTKTEEMVLEENILQITIGESPVFSDDFSVLILTSRLGWRKQEINIYLEIDEEEV